MTVRIALVGDYNAAAVAHRAIPPALEIAASRVGTCLKFDWKHTATLGALDGYHGVWCVPASPYTSEAAAISAIGWARENNIPFLGTCGGFQHAVLEFARNVLKLPEAAHAETAPGAECLVISRMSCFLIEAEQPVFAVPGTRLAGLYGMGEIQAGYHCSFGLNPRFEPDLERAGMRISARNAAGEARAMELADHPFFFGTLFQPERTALRGENAPIISAFVSAARTFAEA